MRNGIYINHKTKEMFVHQSKNTQYKGIITHDSWVKKMIEDGFEYLCYSMGIASLQEQPDGYKFVTYATHTKPKDIDTKADALAYAEAVVAILKKQGEQNGK